MYILVIKYCYYFAFSDVQMKGFFKLVGVEQLTSKPKNIVFMQGWSHHQYHFLEKLLSSRRQRGGVVRGLDLQFRGLKFKSRPEH